MKHSNDLRCYGISFWLCCFVVIVSTHRHCLPPDVPSDGKYTPTHNKFFPGAEVTYSCGDGFILIGEGTRKCNYNGEWSDRTPFCDRAMKLKIFYVYNMPSHSLTPSIIDDNSKTSSLLRNCAGCYLELQLEKLAVFYAIKIFLDPGYVNIEIRTALDNNTEFFADYTGYVDKSQWILVKCISNYALGDRIQIYNRVSGGIAVCEVQVFAKDEKCCDPVVFNPTFTPNGQWISLDPGKKVSIGSRKQLKCNDGYQMIGGPDTVTCSRNAIWGKTNATCAEKLCDPDVFNLTFTPNGQWIFLDPGKKVSAGTRRQLKCNPGYQMIGSPNEVACEKNGMWASTNAACVEEKLIKSSKEKSLKHVVGAVGGSVLIIILILLGIIIYLIRKRKNVVVVVKTTDGNTTPGSESEYAIPYYESIQPDVPSTPRPAAPPLVLNDGYSLPEDCQKTVLIEPMPAHITSGALKESVIYGN